MKTLQIGDNDLMGSRFNGHLLHKYLRDKKGLNSKHLVWHKHSADPDVIKIFKFHKYSRWAMRGITERIEKYFSIHAMLYPWSFFMHKNKVFKQADIAHYHLIHNCFMSIYSLPKLTKLKPSVWTIHDPWAFTGHCVHPFDCEKWKTGCGNCPYPDTPFKIQKDTTAWTWKKKKNIFNKCKFDIVVASKFMHDMAKASPFTQNSNIHKIPFGVDLDIFKPASADLRKYSRVIPPENVVLCFRSDLSKFKGLNYIIDALKILKTDVPVTILTLNEYDHISMLKTKYQILELGWIDDQHELATAYQTADIFIMPSLAESFGMMAVEAMACGKPSIVFDGTALPDTVFAPKGGVVVPSKNVEALAAAIKDLIENKQKRLKIGEEARKLAVEHYNVNTHFDRITNLYEDILSRNKKSGSVS